MASRPEVSEAVSEIMGVAQEWLRVYGLWRRAADRRTRVAERSESLLREATGGLSVARWEAVCRRRSIRRVSDAQTKARALRARPAVAVALAQRERLAAETEAEVVAARVELAAISARLAAYGAVGADLVGLDVAALGHFARLPPTSRRSRPAVEVAGS